MAMTHADVSSPGARRQAVDPWEPWRFTVLLGFLSVICLNPAIFQENRGMEAATEGSAFNQILWTSLLLASLLTMQDGWPRVRFQFSPALLFALGWMLLTVWFALAPDISIRRYVLTAIVITVTLCCVASPRDDNALIKAILAVAIFEITLKYAVVLGMPSVGVHSANGNEPQLAGLWRGHYAHKNLAGAVCVMQIFAFFAMRRRIPLVYLLIPIVLDLTFLIYSGSKTSMALVAASIILVWIIAHTRGIISVGLLIVGLLIAINALTLLTIYSSSFQELLQDTIGDVSFTGRADIWRFLTDYIPIHPWAGSGFQSFWQVGPVSPALQDGRAWLAGAGHGHQGYLDLAAAVGIPGLALASLFIVIRPIMDVGRVTARYDTIFQMYLMFWIFGLLHNATESSLFDRAHPVWVFTLIGICGIRRAALRKRDG